MAYISHTVVALLVHEPGKETIYWKKGREQQKMRTLETSDATSQLTAWFILNQREEEARQYTFLEIPFHYRYAGM